MSATTRLLWPALTLAMLAGCAAAPPAPMASVTPVAAINVSCQTDALSDQPCIAQARQKCSDATVDTIHLVLAKPVTTGVEQYRKEVYDYRATYTCPGQNVASEL
jgi:hypothetical protein